MLTFQQIVDILEKIEYKDWKLRYSLPWDNLPWIQWQIPDEEAPDKIWHCRKWMLSYHMTQSEIIQTAFLAVQVAEEHETREKFLYQGVPVLGPHYNLNTLTHLIKEGQLKEDVRS